MNREILFRAKSGQTWYYGGVFCRNVYHGAIGCDDYTVRWYIVTKDWDTLQVNPKTICQYTGLTDKNGVKIFEGDIVRISEDYYDGLHTTGTQVYYSKGAFCVDYETSNYDVTSIGFLIAEGVEVEVIANIYDNKIDEEVV